jgi:nucleoside-diphosphate-sugar epimerase
MRLFVTGGAGHTGCNFLDLYLSESSDNEAVALVRASSDRSYLPAQFGSRLTIVDGDIQDSETSRYMNGCDAVMHIAHQNLCPIVIDRANEAGVERVFFVTTTGIFSKFNDLSANYLQIEDQIKSSRLDWTILRPTMIYGSERDVNMHKLLIYLDSHPVFPIFGRGDSLMQPVYSGDLAMGLLLAVNNAKKTSRKEYNLPGRSPLTYNELVETAIKELGRKAGIVHIPQVLSEYLATAAEKLLRDRSPIKVEQVRRLTEDKAYSWSASRADFQYDPGSFAVRVRLEIARLRSIGLLKTIK